MYPMKIMSCYKDYLWGGNRLRTLFGKESSLPKLAESWELACHPDGQCIVVNGRYGGRTLNSVLLENGVKLLGDEYRGDGAFPILVKFIDAAQDLSIQVHPSDASARGTERGKAEMWYVVECEPRAYIYYGFNRRMTKEEVITRAQDGSICDVLNRVPVHKGDVFYILPGTVHAIGKGIVVAEIQQNSNTTFRLYDYQRRGADGKLRPLHLERAAEVVCCEPSIPSEARSNNSIYLNGLSLSEMFSCPYFSAYQVDVANCGEFHCGRRSFQHLLFVDGKGDLIWRGERYPFQSGDSYFLPANIGTYQLKGHCRVLLSSL